MGEASRRKKAGEYPQQTPRPAKAREPAPEGGLDWTLVGVVADHPKTGALLAALEQLKAGLNPDGGGKLMTACLETSDRKPVLVARTVGLGNWMALIGVFQQLDLTDRLEHVMVSSGPYDAAFS